MSEFWRGKRVLVTGHTGFKGSWLALWLTELGAEVFGFALAPDTAPALFDQLRLAEKIDHRIGDIRDAAALSNAVEHAAPDVIFHLAAQPLVLASYKDPVETWQTNVMGSINVMQAARNLQNPCALVMITTDKVYENREWSYPYRETDALGGHDPYSSSKAAMEIAVSSWRKSFLNDTSNVRMASARAGNVIGGGDWADNRIVPDLIRALKAEQTLDVRAPQAIRPWQHVLEPLAGYMVLAQNLFNDVSPELQDAFNFGPEASDIRTVEQLIEESLKHWGGNWQDTSDPNQLHEAKTLSLTIEKAKNTLGFAPRIDFAQSVAMTINWYKEVANGADPLDVARAQIKAFSAL